MDNSAFSPLQVCRGERGTAAQLWASVRPTRERRYRRDSLRGDVDRLRDCPAGERQVVIFPLRIRLWVSSFIKFHFLSG